MMINDDYYDVECRIGIGIVLRGLVGIELLGWGVGVGCGEGYDGWYFSSCCGGGVNGMVIRLTVTDVQLDW